MELGEPIREIEITPQQDPVPREQPEPAREREQQEEPVPA